MTSKSLDKDVCADFKKCLAILHTMLDNEASQEEENYLMSHLEKCIFCFEQYEVEKQIKQLIKSKIHKLDVPADLIKDIKNKIAQSA